MQFYFEVKKPVSLGRVDSDDDPLDHFGMRRHLADGDEAGFLQTVQNVADAVVELLRDLVHSRQVTESVTLGFGLRHVRSACP